MGWLAPLRPFLRLCRVRSAWCASAGANPPDGTQPSRCHTQPRAACAVQACRMCACTQECAGRLASTHVLAAREQWRAWVGVRHSCTRRCVHAANMVCAQTVCRGGSALGSPWLPHPARNSCTLTHHLFQCQQKGVSNAVSAAASASAGAPRVPPLRIHSMVS